MFCTQCGKEMFQGANYCAYCGIPLPDSADISNQSPAHPAAIRTGPPKGSPGKEEMVGGSWLTSTFAYAVYWVALVGSAAAILLGSWAPQTGWALALSCGAVAYIIAKKKSRSGWLWFWIGLIPIGFGAIFFLVFLNTIMHRLG